MKQVIFVVIAVVILGPIYSHLDGVVQSLILIGGMILVSLLVLWALRRDGGGRGVASNQSVSSDKIDWSSFPTAHDPDPWKPLPAQKKPAGIQWMESPGSGTTSDTSLPVLTRLNLFERLFRATKPRPIQSFNQTDVIIGQKFDRSRLN